MPNGQSPQTLNAAKQEAFVGKVLGDTSAAMTTALASIGDRSTWNRPEHRKKKRCASWEMRRDGFYETDRARRSSRPHPGPTPGIKGPL